MVNKIIVVEVVEIVDKLFLGILQMAYPSLVINLERIAKGCPQASSTILNFSPGSWGICLIKNE
jgi:hypothetical protein